MFNHILFISALSAAYPVSATALEMVPVAGGTFERGATGGERDEHNTQQVRLSAFEIGKFEVTRGEYLAVMGSVPGASEGDLDLPVTEVSWRDALTFANALSVQGGLTPVYDLSSDEVAVDWSANGYRLPTEAEWEFAARGGVDSEGYIFAGSDNLSTVGWYQDNATAVRPVGQLAPNELGLHDMSGNVWEWVWDFYAPYPNAATVDPKGPESGDRRVSRGGSVTYDPNRARSTNRSAELRHAPSPHDNDLGFRLARNAAP